jgi:DNA (cytosine-5)-methyltransferase 1
MTPSAYYNEIDPFAAQWLRNLIAAGHIAPGEVDERSIEDVTPDDLRGFTQCHFFAGIGVWSHSLRLAGWPDDRPVWTGSCPCQPFSAAGKGDGFADERHLWPHFFHLISERRPQHVFGEQVAAGNANAWFDLVQADLEGMGYAFGLVPFTSAGIGAPHIRERAYWVAMPTASSVTGAGTSGRQEDEYSNGGDDVRLADSNHDRQQPGQGWVPMRRTGSTLGGAANGGLGNANVARLERLGGNDGAAGREGTTGPVAAPGIHMRAIEVNGFWRDADWLLCRDGKWRPVEPGTFPLVDGAAARWDESSPGWQEWQAATASAA